MAAQSSLAQAQVPPGPPSALDPLLKAIGQEKYTNAKKQADAIMKSGMPADRRKASLLYGRILLGLGQKQPAQQYLAMMVRQNLDGDAAQLLLVYQAWLTALNGDRDAAIKTLEETLTKSMPYTSTAEAADVLAMLYMAKGDQAGAKRAVDFGLKFLQYRDIKEDYLVTLLRGRLRSNIASPEAKKLYDAAEKLRAQGKYREAGQGFTELTVRFPANVWAHAAGYRIGQCLLGLNQPQQALTHWRQFIEQQPKGPWRGQARVGCTDLVLESRLDLKAALEHTRAAASDLENVEGEAASSWQEIAHEIHLRHGLVSLVEGRYDAAANAFTETRMALPKKAGTEKLAEGLDRLIEMTQNRGPLLPPELAVGDDRGSTALSIAMVYYLLRRHDPAERFFEMPLSGTARSRSEAHRSFASLGLARVTVARAKASPPDKSSTSSKASSPWQQAKALYLQSIKEHPNARWHDETLRESGLLIEYVAQREAAAAEDTASEKKKAAGRTPQATSSTQVKHREQTAALQKARAEALPHWSALVERYSKSRHLPQALFHAGVLLAEAGRNAEAVASFARLAEEFPTSPWTGEAHVRLIDVKLEREFDLEGAQQHVDAAIDWFEGLDRDSVAKARRALDDETTTMRGVDRVGYDIYLRSGLLAYLQERFEQAKLWFEKAKPLAPPRNLVRLP